MKKSGIIATAAFLAAVVLSGCNLNNTKNTEGSDNSVITETTISISEMENEIKTLTEENNKYNQLFDDKVRSIIDKYAELYLSYSVSPGDNISKLKDYVTEDYYEQLISMTGHEKPSIEYEQATGVSEIYCGKYNFDNFFFAVAVCSQTTLYDDEVTNSNVVYKFKIQINDDVYKIASVEKII